MKQTNNAIKFLMAQYRAIFKNAYFKGMATALVLTAGLAAGAAQAADEVYYSDDGKTWTTTSGTGRIAGAVAGVHLNPATEGTTAANGKLNITSTWSGSGSIYGGYVDTTKLDSGKDVDVSAVGNTLNADGDVVITNSGSVNLVGGWAKTQNGFALASDNKVIVEVGNSNVTDGSVALKSGGQVIGAWASSLNGATAQNNIVELSGNNKSGDTYLHLGNGAFGAMAFVDANATGGDYVAQGNTLDVSYTSSTGSGDSGLWLIGGYAYTNGSAGSGSGAADSLQAIGNSIIADHVTIGSASGSGAGLVVGNLATNNLSGSIADVVVNGNGQETLHISDSTFYHTSVFGGQAVNYAGGSATANANTVNITDSDFLANTSGNNAIFGGQASTTLTSGDQTATLDASSNVVSITNTNADKSTRSVVGSIIGAQVKVASGSGSNLTDFVSSTLTANNNSVTVGEGITVSSGSVYGAYIGTDGQNVTSGGATINASNNSVTFNGTFTGDTGGDDTNIAGAIAEPGVATMNNNHVTINGKVSGVSFIYGAFASKQGEITGQIDNPQHNLNNNSITIGSKAEVTGAKIWAAGSAETSALTFNNDVTIEGTVKNSDVYGGTGADSAITLAAGGTLAYTSETAGTTNVLRSDVVNLAGTVNVGTNDTLKISGFVHNGNQNATTYNTNETNIASSATIYNRNTVELLGDTTVANGAKLHALSAGAKILVNGDVSGSTITDTLDPQKDIDFDMVGGRGSLNISAADLKSYLTAGDAYTLGNVSSTDKAGTVDLASGGVLNFADNSVVISDFDYSATDAPSKITVETDTTSGGSVIKGNELTIAHKLAQNATTAETYKDLQAVNAAGIKIEANTLNLGSSTLSSDQSAAIEFAEAKAKEEINFIARTSGKDISDTDGSELGTFNDGYHLTSKVIGSNFMLTNDQDSNKEYYTSLAGNINGVVTVEGDDGHIHIKDGDWTANDLVTVTSGGNITVGSGTESTSIETGSQPDATLSLAAGLVLDVTNSGTATVTANGDNTSAYQEPDSDDFYGDNRYVALDLTHGVDMKIASDGTVSGKAVIEATSGGVVLLNASDVNDLLAQNHAAGVNSGSGAFLNASSGGELRVDGDITAQFRDFDGSGDTNGFNLSGDGQTIVGDKTSGRLVANSLTIVNPHSGTVQDDADYIATAPVVHLGGAVIVDDLEINDLQQTNGEDKPAGTNTYASQVTIADGGALISHSLTSYNDKLILGQEGTSSAILYFESDAVADEGTVTVNKIELSSGSEIDFANGNWDASATDFNLSGAGSRLIVGDDYDYDVNENPYSATLVAGDLTMGADTTLFVAANGTASFNGANLKDLTAPVDGNDDAGILVAGYLTINGTAISDTNTNGGVIFGEEGSIRIANNGTLNFGNAAVNGAIVADGQHTGDTVTLRDGYTKIANQGGTLRLDLADSTTFSANAIQSLKNQLFTAGSFNSDGILADGGLLNIGMANFTGFTGYDTVDDPANGLHGYTATWDEVKSFTDIFSEDVTNDMNSTANITGIDPGDEVKGAWGSLSMNPNVPSTAQVTLAGNTTLSYAEGNNGFFISDAAHDNALGAIVEAQKTLNLVNGGTIGKVTLTNGKDNANDERNLTTLNINGNGKLTTINSIDTVIGSNTTTYATRVNVNSDADVTGDITGVGRVNVNEGATLHVYNPDASSKDVPEVLVNTLAVVNGNAQIDGDLIIDGQYSSQDYDFGGEGEAYAVGGTITATNIELEHDASLTTVHGGLIRAETVTAVADTNGQSDSFITVGQDLDYETWDDTEDAAYTGTGYLEISKYLDLNGGTLMVDPVYGEATSVAAVMNFKDGSDKTWDSVKNDVGIVDGRALIGKNAALGIGATLAETRAVIADFQENGSLSQEKYGSILYLNGQLTLADGSEIALNADPVTADVDGIRRALKYTITSNQLDQFATLGLGDRTAILMSEAAFEDADGKKTQTAIHFDREAAVINANGGEIVLIGAFDASEKLNFFSDNDSGNNNGVDIVNASGADGTIKVYTQNGFLFATLTGKNQGQGVQLHVDQDKAFSVMSEASYPVVETLISYHEDRIAQDTTTTPETPAPEAPEAGNENQSGTSSETTNTETEQQLASRVGEQQTTETTTETTPEPSAPVANTRVTGSSNFLNEVVTKSHGAPAEAAARLAIYGGAVQAAMAATSSTTDAIAARMGVGNTANITMANNGQGAALWLAPVYKTHDSDSFDSQGLDYGVDMNLYGVALGADFEFMPGLTAGVMFNVGSGDADGQGNAAANNTSNDFDYWGAAIYGNYTYDALSVTADVSYTAVDNDLEASTGMSQYGKLESATDTTAISLGVTAKYTFDLGGVEVAPHAGLRYTNIDLDDYSIKSNGETIADYSADKVNIFSIPVGVTFAKEFTGDAWTVKPSLDLTLTGNFGDDDISGDVSWTGVNNLVTPVSSEYMDDFTYGATLGIEAASTGSFSLGLGVNYTGSSNVDEFGVNANARFVF